MVKYEKSFFFLIIVAFRAVFMRFLLEICIRLGTNNSKSQKMSQELLLLCLIISSIVGTIITSSIKIRGDNKDIGQDDGHS